MKKNDIRTERLIKEAHMHLDIIQAELIYIVESIKAKNLKKAA